MTVEITLEVLFYGALTALVYTYVGYPLLVFMIAKLFPKKNKTGEFEPTVTFLITAYNEEESLAQKLEDTLNLDYPSDKLEILVASDGSNDRTDEIATEFESRGVRLFRQEGRKGKTYTQNKAVEQAAGEIILFSDATTKYNPDVLKKLTPLFSDESVGCAAGKLVYVDRSESAVGKGAKSYWGYETFLKQNESDACSLIGASGCLYAVRKSAYRPMYPEACSDFLICSLLYEQGLRSVYVPEAVCKEITNRTPSSELTMRTRVVSQTFTDLWRNRGMMNPFKSGFYAIQLISHKLFRYMAPLFLLLIFLTSLFLAPNDSFFAVVLIMQSVFYALGAAALFLERIGKRSGPLSVILYFLIANIASIAGFYKFLIGEQYASWEPIRKNTGAGNQA